MTQPLDFPVDDLRAIFGRSTIIDLSHTLEPGMPAWPTHARYASTLQESYDEGGESVHSTISLSEHSGTHVDAPVHFHRGGLTVDELPLDALIGRLVVIDASDLGAGETLPIAAIHRHEQAHGAIERGDIVIFRFGWDEKWAPQPRDRDFLAGWPGLGEDSARYLIERGVKAVGTDAASPDPSEADANPCHVLLLGAGVPLLENVANLNSLPPHSFAIGLPLKLGAGSGSPVRLLAILGNHED